MSTIYTYKHHTYFIICYLSPDRYRLTRKDAEAILLYEVYNIIIILYFSTEE